MRIFACIYVDDACITMPYVSGDADTEATANAALAELSSTDGPYSYESRHREPVPTGLTHAQVCVGHCG